MIVNQFTMDLFPPLTMQGAHPAHGVPGASLSGVPMGIHSSALPARNVRTGQGFGTAPHKLVRRQDPDTSYESAAKVDSAGLEAMVYEAISTFRNGCTSDELRAMPVFAGKAYSSVTARYKALMDKRLIEDTGERRAGNAGRPMRVMRKVTA